MGSSEVSAEYIRLEPYTMGLTGYNVYWKNGKHIGTFERDVDGFYYFWPLKDEGGCWSDYALRAIADKLTEINKPWADKIANDPTI